MSNESLIVSVRSRACAIPIANVVETMRPLPIEPIAGSQSFVRGLSVIRGAPTPVVDLGLLVGAGRAKETGRFVALKLGGRSVALAVDAVIGVRRLDATPLDGMPPLLRDASAGVIEAIGVLDAQLLLVLTASRLLPEDVAQPLPPGVTAS